MRRSKYEKTFYEEIQKKLFYLIPEKWDSVYLYAAVIDSPYQRPTGEMYFYYFPKGILKRKPVNAYEIPAIFNIDEDKYSELINGLFISIKKLRNLFVLDERKVWSNVTISIENFQFKVEYDYEDLNSSKYDSYERHVIWRYKYLHPELDLYSKRERSIIERYIKDVQINGTPRKDIYIEGIYDEPVHNIIEYERTMSVDEAIARNHLADKEEKKKAKKEKVKKKQKQVVEEEVNYTNNQILFGNRKKD